MSTEDLDIEALVIALMERLCLSGPMRAMELTRSLGLRHSQTERLLAFLGRSEALGGLDYVHEIHKGHVVLIDLTDKGKALCAQRQIEKA